MGLENLEQDRADLQAVLDDLNAGRITLRHGQDEFVATMKWRLRVLDRKLARHGTAESTQAAG